MKITIEELGRQAEQRYQKQEELSKSIDDLLTAQEEAKAEAQTAAEAGDLDGFRKANDRATDLAERLIVARAQYNKMGAGAVVNDAEADEAWRDFLKGYEQEFDTLMEAFKAKKEEMLQAYGKIIDLQRDCFEKREKLARYCGIKTRVNSIHDNPYQRKFPCSKTLPVTASGNVLSLNGTTCQAPDAVYYLASFADKHRISGIALQTDAEFGALKNILILQKTDPFN